MDDTRERILEAARQLCRASGFRVDGKEIALAAGVSEAAMYRRFPRRTDILEAVLREMLDGADRRLLEIAADRASRAWQSIHAINRVGFESVDRYGMLATETTAGRLPPPLDAHMDYVRALWSLMGNVIKRGIAEGDFRGDVSPRFLVVAWRGLVSTDSLAALREDGPGRSCEETSDLVTRVLLSALRGTGETPT